MGFKNERKNNTELSILATYYPCVANSDRVPNHLLMKLTAFSYKYFVS